MKNLVKLATVVGLSCMMLFPLVGRAEVIIGVVNIQKIMNDIKEGKSVNDKLQKSFESKKAELKKEEDRIKKSQDEMMKQASLLSAEAKSQKQMKMQEEILKLQQKTMEYQKDIQKQEADLKKPILEKLKEVVDEISKAEGVDFTVEVSSSPVVYAKSKKELSDLVIKAYDKKHAK
jgi:outer membrane protein